MLWSGGMLIARCAWHGFFRGYPRPLRVISWRGRGVSFSDTICRSCADRVRIEGLWGTSPPAPVWPGAPQTALIFVGLPLVTALVLLATPLDDAAPPPHHAARPVGGYLAATETSVQSGEIAAAAMPNVVAPGAAARDEDPPPVIYETRRRLRPVRARGSDAERKTPPAMVADRRSDRARSPARAKAITLAVVPVSSDSGPASTLAPQSP